MKNKMSSVLIFFAIVFLLIGLAGSILFSYSLLANYDRKFALLSLSVGCVASLVLFLALLTLSRMLSLLCMQEATLEALVDGQTQNIQPAEMLSKDFDTLPDF